MKNLKEIEHCEVVEDLEVLGIGRLEYEISGRGGHLGFKGVDVARFVDCNAESLPRNYGCYCNYLGGGVRGAVAASGFDRKAVRSDCEILLDALAEACKRAYINAEGSLNDEEDADGEPNWDALASNASRKAGVVSAY
jgi:hypothetical protein